MIFSFAWKLCWFRSPTIFLITVNLLSDFIVSDKNIVWLFWRFFYDFDIILDLLSVSETAAEPPQDEGSSLNSPRNLALEATFINHNFSQQVLRADVDKHKFPEENPFAEADDSDDEEKNSKTQVASVGYRYRKWDLGNNIRLIARTEHDAVFGTEKEKSYMNVKALNEWDSR